MIIENIALISVISTAQRGQGGLTKLVPQDSVFPKERGKAGKSTASIQMTVINIICARQTVTKDLWKGLKDCFALSLRAFAVGLLCFAPDYTGLKLSFIVTIFMMRLSYSAGR